MKIEGIHVIAHQPEGEAHPLPVLFVHGAWHGAWCWEPHFLPAFAAKGFASYALDLRGHGKTPNDRVMATTGYGHYVQDVATVAARIARIHGRHPVLVGHSMGGYITMRYMERFIVPGAALLAPIPVIGTLPLFLRLMRDYPLTTLSAAALVHPYQFVKQVERAHTLFFSGAVPREQVAQYQAQMVNESLTILLQTALFNRARPEKAHAAPVLLLAAAQDAIFTIAEQQATAHAYNTEAEVFPDMAHDMMLEPDWQAVADRIMTWIDEAVAPPTSLS